VFLFTRMQRSHSWFFYLCTAEGILTLFALLLVPSEGGSVSWARLALVGIIAFFAGLGIYFGIRPPRGLEKWAQPHIILSSALLSLTFGLLLFLLRYLDPERLLPIYERLGPLLWYLLALTAQSIFFLLYIKNGLHPEAFKQRKQTYLSALVVFSALFFLFILVSLTRLGITPDPAYWGEPGVALLGWQFGLALLGGILVLLLSSSMKESILDIILPLSIYIVAVALWLSVPLDVLANGFYVTINPPTFQPFPYSDAGYYDRTAHSLLLGYSYQEGIPIRPLFIVYLALLHTLFGENYPAIIAGQTALLALIPVVFYFLGKKIHSRIAGTTTALFFIFRELTSLLITSNTRVTNSKSLLVELPTLFLLILSCYLVFRWLERREPKSAFIAGGMFGLLLFMRTQTVMILPFVLLVALLTFGWRNRSFYGQAALLVLGMAVTILPWLTRNYVQTGQFAFDSASQSKLLASQYAYSGNLDIQNYDFEGKGLAQVLIEFAVKDPGFVFGFIANHFLATEIHGVLALPLFKPYNGIFEPVNLYWVTWDGTLEWYNVALFLFYLLMIAFGIGKVWNRWRWIGLLPVAYNLGYALATALSRFSGWRYDYPADWVPYFYFGVGFAETAILVSTLFGGREVNSPKILNDHRNLTPMPVLFVLFALIGAIPWVAEKIPSPRYANRPPSSLIERVVSMPGAPTLTDLQVFLSRPESFMEIGQVLYPRYFPRNKGLESSNPWPVYEPRDFPRLGFLLMNEKFDFAIFPSKGIPEPFPHAADAIVVGCRREEYVDVRMIAFPDLDAILTSTPLTVPCSP